MCSVTVEPSDSERISYDLQPGMTLVELYTASQDRTVKVNIYIYIYFHVTTAVFIVYVR